MEMNNLEIGIFKTQLCVSLFFLFLLPVLSPGGLPDPGIEPGSPALQADSLLTEL